MQKICYIFHFFFELQNSCLKNFVIKFIFFQRYLTGLFIIIFFADTRTGGTIFKFFLSLFYNILLMYMYQNKGIDHIEGVRRGEKKKWGKRNCGPDRSALENAATHFSPGEKPFSQLSCCTACLPRQLIYNFYPRLFTVRRLTVAPWCVKSAFLLPIDSKTLRKISKSMVTDFSDTN